MEFQYIYDKTIWEEIEIKLETIFPEWELSFADLVREVYVGNGKGILQILEEKTENLFLMEWNQIKQIAFTITIVIFLSSVFTVFKDAFQNRQIAEISFYINYLVLIVVFINLFSETLQVGENALKNIEEFMLIFFPAFALVVGTSSGVGTGILFYQMSGIVIYMVERCLLVIVLPGISIFMLFVIMNGIWEEEKLTLLLEFLKKALKFTLKIILGILTGTSMIQSLITPVIERIKGETIYKTVESIPGIGELTEGAIRVWLGSAVLIKNSIGIVGCVVLLLISFAPLVRIFTIGSMLKILAALLSIIGDKKMIQCTNQVGEGIFLILQAVSYGIIFFIVLIAIAAYTMNGGF